MVRIAELHVGQGQPCGSVTLFPVWTASPPMRGLVTGSKARAAAAELPSGAVVPRLQLHNAGPSPALLLEGELLEGGLQTRALSTDVILGPGTTVEVDVACVEQGRWHGGADHGRRARRAPNDVRRSLRGPSCDRQGQVWSDVARYEQAAGATPTSSLADHLDRAGGSVVARTLSGQTGVIVGWAGQPRALELFGSESMLRAHLPGIVEAASLESLLWPAVQTVPGRPARRFAARIQLLDLDHEPAVVGIGDTLRGETSRLSAHGITLSGRGVAHLGVLDKAVAQ